MTVSLPERVRVDLDQQLAAPSFFRDPYPVYAELRRHNPVHWSDVLQSWVLTRYDDVFATLHEPQLLSSAGRMTKLLDQLPQPYRESVRWIDTHYAATLPFMNPPRHTRVRSLFNKAFTPRVVEGMRGEMQAIVDELLAPFQAGDQLDLMRDLAYPLPIIVISALVGVPSQEREQFKRWTYEIFGIFSSGRAVLDTVETGRRSLLETRAYLSDLIAQRRRQPQDDMISRLIAVEEQGDVLTAEEVLANCVTLFVAGHETTNGLIGNAMAALLRHPDQLARLRAEPALIGSAIEEFLRYDGSLQRNWRLATADLTLHGVTIRQGEMVSQMLGAANRDPEQFIEPDRLDLSRPANRHLGFGHGLHYCIGAPLARVETELAILTLLRRFPRLRLASDSLEWRADYTFRSLTSLPVEL
jgi:cytochrome P450